jgi:hypothetical protein
MAVNTPTSTTRSHRSEVSESNSHPHVMPARYVPLSELSRSFAEPYTSPVYTNNSHDLPAGPLMNAYNPRPGQHYHAKPVQHPIYPGTQPNTPAEPSAPPTSGGPPRLTWQYARIWDNFPSAQYVPPALSGWYLSNPIPAIQISPYYMPYPHPNLPPPCDYCGATWGEHPFDQCPHAIACIYCTHNYPKPTCPTLHQSCNPLVCLVPENH